MPPRLTEIYRADDAVEVFFGDEEPPGWRAAIVIALEHPGVWVRTEDGKLWFVTNRRHIRGAPRRP